MDYVGYERERGAYWAECVGLWLVRVECDEMSGALWMVLGWL